jgi:hypothetical protein
MKELEKCFREAGKNGYRQHSYLIRVAIANARQP